jgi:hypothetical protein
MADEFSVYSSMNPDEATSFNVLKRVQQIVLDSNNGIYSGPEIIWDSGLQSISNSNQYIDWRQSEMVIPVHLSAYKFGGDDSLSQDTVYMQCLKNNFAMVHSLRVTLSNNELISYSVPFANLKMSYDFITNMTSEMEEQAMGVGVVYSDSDCFTFQTAPSPYGLGTVNTDISLPYQGDSTGSVISAEHNFARNEKRYKKVMRTNKNAESSGRYNAYVDTSVLRNSQDTYVGDITSAQVGVWINCRIPMACLHSLFRALPLVKNSLFSISIIHNGNTAIYPTLGGTDFATLTSASQYRTVTFNSFTHGSNPFNIPNGYLPFEIGSLIRGGGAGVGLSDSSIDGTRPLGCKCTIATNSLSNGTSVSPFGNCRLLLSLVTLDPVFESRYLANPIKKVLYEDAVWKNITCQAGQSFDQLVFNNVSRMRKLVMLPYGLNTESNLPSSDLVSPWSSFGGSYLSAPLARITDFNIQVSGAQLFPQNLTTLQQFYTEFKQCQMINGGAVGPDVPQNSLISMYDYGMQYGAIVVDLSRRLESTDPLTQTVSISFRNPTKRNLGFMCFLYYQKEINIDAQLGVLVA